MKKINFRFYCESCCDKRKDDEDIEDMSPFEMQGFGPTYKNEFGMQSRRFKCPICHIEILAVIESVEDGTPTTEKLAL